MQAIRNAPGVRRYVAPEDAPGSARAPNRPESDLAEPDIGIELGQSISKRMAGCTPPTMRYCASCVDIGSRTSGGAACLPRPT